MLGELIIGGILSAGALYCLCFSGDEGNKVCNYKEIKDGKNPKGIIVSEHVRLSVKQSNRHMLMVAPSGTGKSHSFFTYNVRDLDGSLVVNDPSGEMSSYYSGEKYIFNPFDSHSISIDPLANCRNEFDVDKLASIILDSGKSKGDDGKQQEWLDMAKPLLQSYMIYNWHVKKYTFCECILNVMTKPLIGKTPQDDSIAKEVFYSEIEGAILRLKSFLRLINAQGTLSSVYAVVNTCLRLFMDNNVNRITSRNDFDITKMRERKMGLFIEIPDRHAEYFRPLTNIIINQLLDKLFDTDGLQVYFLLDEFGNMTIDGMSGVLSTARKKHISICAALQTFTQIRDRYGIEYESIMEMFRTIVICPGLRKSAEYVASLIGETRTDSKTEPLMTASEIRTLETGKLLIVMDNKRVVKDNMLSAI